MREFFENAICVLCMVFIFIPLAIVQCVIENVGLKLGFWK